MCTDRKAEMVLKGCVSFESLLILNLFANYGCVFLKDANSTFSENSSCNSTQNGSDDGFNAADRIGFFLAGLGCFMFLYIMVLCCTRRESEINFLTSPSVSRSERNSVVTLPPSYDQFAPPSYDVVVDWKRLDQNEMPGIQEQKRLERY
ncbi:uncharacterized protein LOC112905019 [Agrilus planipennis]|uniref:Uncharacterized protein LOC112905019 n=1 Tax=Agrilus planipennis TaxID=224129 RepID=A0A7F5R8M4_AGRPL|nr:uncharacterized protein LOC112905019 [Agrilus planipennis]